MDGIRDPPPAPILTVGRWSLQDACSALHCLLLTVVYLLKVSLLVHWYRFHSVVIVHVYALRISLSFFLAEVIFI